MAKGPILSDKAVKAIVFAVGAYLLFKFISDSVANAEDKVVSGVQGAFDSITGSVQGAVNGVVGGFNGISQGITGGFATIGQGITNGINLIGSGITSGVTNIGQTLDTGYQLIDDGVSATIHDLTSIPGNLAQSVQNNLAPVSTTIQFGAGLLGGGIYSLFNSGTSTDASVRSDGVSAHIYNFMDDYSMTDNPNWANEDTLP